MVIGRIFWDEEHPGPWLSFKNITEFRTWARDMRKVSGKRYKAEYAYVDLTWTAAGLLQREQDKSKGLQY